MNPQTFIFFGPSGCGKSTLLHCILGLEPPTSGQVLVEGKDFYKLDEDERALYRRFHVGMVFQQPLWISALNIIENVSFPLHLLGLDEKEIFEKAKKNLQDSVVEAKSIEELNNAVKNKKMAKAQFCGSSECEDSIKEKSDGATSRCIPFEQKKTDGKCVNCDKNAQFWAYFAKAY